MRLDGHAVSLINCNERIIQFVKKSKLKKGEIKRLKAVTPPAEPAMNTTAAHDYSGFFSAALS
jgi:hypothetical protein